LALRCEEKKSQNSRVKYFGIIANNFSKAGWSWGCVATVDREGRTIFVADAHRSDGRRFVVRADEKLTAFMELEAIQFMCLDERPKNGRSKRHKKATIS
jgi:hypothetical protein